MSLQEEIVISGIGGHYPKSINLEVFKDYLMKNESLMEPYWRKGEKGVSNILGKIPSSLRFDSGFFGIHRQQCTFMDPMQRMALERTFEALIDAGINPADIRGKRIGVFIGSSVGENDNLFYESVISGFGITGHARSMMANRISYWLNLKGPSVAYDSNWLNGLEVLQLAVDSIKEGHCEAAIVGTSNLILNSEVSWQYNNMGLLSPDGQTKAFDENADGYGRSDAVVVLLIQRAPEAKRCYATIIDVKTTYNGNRDGKYLDVNLPTMTKFLGNFYSNCGVDPKTIEFIETYGTALKHVDELEMKAIDDVFCKNRREPLLVGSVKTNCGHSEASSAFLALSKVIIAMETGIIPANLCFDTPNKNIAALVDGRAQVVTANREWKGEMAAVNCIGFSSSYGHLLLKSNPKNKEKRTGALLPKLIVASTRTEEGIQDILNTVASHKDVDDEYIALIHDVFARSITGHLYRGYAVLDETNEDIRKDFQHFPGNKRPIWFVYSGMGSQWCKMANDLMALPMFAQSIQKSHDILVPKGIDLLKIVTDDDPKVFDNILHSFVGIAAVQIALTDILHALGIVPDGIIGHSVGELGCAYADGCLTAEQMILSAYSRGRASLEAELINGMMAAVGIGYQQMKDKCPETIEVACHNGPDSSTISGPTADMEEFVNDLQSKGVFARLVNVSNIAYHSRYIQPAGPLLLKYLKEVIPEAQPRTSKWVSTSIPEDQWESDLAKTSSAEYHTNNLLSSVLFEEGSRQIPKEAIVIEIAPHGLLQAILKRSLKPGCTNIPLTQKGNKSGLHFLLAAIGKLYLAGLDLNISAIYPPVTYPVSRGTPTLATLSHWEHSESWRSGVEDKLNYLSNCAEVTVGLRGEEMTEFFGNKIEDYVVLPPSAYFKLIYDILLQKTSHVVTGVVFEDVRFRKVVPLPRAGTVNILVMVARGSGDFEVLADNEVVLSGTAKSLEATDKPFIETEKIERNSDCLTLSNQDIYNEFSHRGHHYGANFKEIKSLTLQEEVSVGTSVFNNNVWLFLESLFQQFLFHAGEKNQNALSISSIQKIALKISELPTEVTDFEVVHHYASGLVSTEHIQICGVKGFSVDLPKKEVSNFLTEFVPLNNPVCCNKEALINWSLHIIVEHYIACNMSIIEVDTNAVGFSESVRNVLSKYRLINANISTVPSLGSVLVSQTDPILLIYNSFINTKIVDLLVASNGLVTSLIRTSKDILSYNNVVQIAQFSYNNQTYSLIRKASQEKRIIIEINSPVFSSTDLNRDNVGWVSELYAALKHNSWIYVVARAIPPEGICNFVNSFKTIPEGSQIRSIFILDKQAPDFSTSNPFYENILRQNLYVTVLKDGCVGTYLPISMELKTNMGINVETLSNIPGLTYTDYIGFSVRDESYSTSRDTINEVGNVDYCGVNSNGERVMGLACVDREQCKLIPDPILQWVYPEIWNPEDAATVPHAYAMAYYSLVEQGRLMIGETVFIHAACSPVGLAAISVSFSYGCQVYATVASEYQKGFLLKTFAGLNPKNILSLSNATFEAELMSATKGEGAHVVLNCLTGTLIEPALRCVAEFGRFLQLGTLETEQWNKIGSFIFLKNVGFLNVTSDSLFKLSTEEKKLLHKHVVNGMNDLFVRPLPRKLTTGESVETILSSLKNVQFVGKIIHSVNNKMALNELNARKRVQYTCNPKYSYLIVGGTMEMCTDMAEWLVMRGATRIVISSEYKTSLNYINRRLSLLQSYFNVDIIFTSNKTHTRESANELISEVYFVGIIGAVFVLPSEKGSHRNDDIKTLHHLDMALRTSAPKALLVNFVEAAAGIAQVRADSGFPICNVQFDISLNYTHALTALDNILKANHKNVVLVNDIVVDIQQETTPILYKKLSLLLPNSVEDLADQVVMVSTKPHFTQLPSLTARTTREIPPLFIIPGISGKAIISEFSKQLYYPVHCAVIPPTKHSLKRTAADLAEIMKATLPKGPFNIIGISCGGPLALELASILEKEGFDVQISLIDGAPETIQSSLVLLGEDKVKEIGILSRVFNITDSESIDKLANLPNWDARVSEAIKQHIHNTSNTNHFEESLHSIRRYIDEISSFEPLENRIQSQIHLLRPLGCNKYDSCGLFKYCEQVADISIINGDHRTILTNPTTAQIINNKVLC